MSRLLARILLAMLIFPLAGMVYMLIVVAMFEWGGYRYEEEAFVLADVVTAAFVATYWVLLWRKSIRWTSNRKLMTGVIVFPALLAGLFIGGPLEAAVSEGFGIFVGGVIAILLWLVLSIFIWRETAEERTARVRAASDEAIVCPTCGYNMTGLREANCPECGARFTINELLAGQPSREHFELSAEQSTSDEPS